MHSRVGRPKQMQHEELVTSVLCHDEGEASELSARLRNFYNTTAEYVAFQAPSSQTLLWANLASDIRERFSGGANRKVRVLEAGAGRSGLAIYLQSSGLRDDIELHAQDVTAQNAAWLEEHFDAVTIGAVGEVPGEFDFVLSSYVLEHVTVPRGFLDSLWSKLAFGGVILMTCPPLRCAVLPAAFGRSRSRAEKTGSGLLRCLAPAAHAHHGPPRVVGAQRSCRLSSAVFHRSRRCPLGLVVRYLRALAAGHAVEVGIGQSLRLYREESFDGGI
jgi:hypothetical protein